MDAASRILSPGNGPPPAVAANAVLPPAPAAPRFCSRCGEALDATLGCLRCVASPGAASAAPYAGHSSGAGITSALALYAVFLVTFAIVTFGPEELWPQFLLQGVDAVLVLAWCVGHRGEIYPLLAPPRRLRWYVLPLGLAVATAALATVVVEASLLIPGAEAILATRDILDRGYGWAAVVLAICVQPAVIEELAFRGIILTVLMRVLSPREAVIVSALLFMAMHLSPLSFPHLFAMGLLLGWLRVATGSIVPAMILHFAHNLIVCLSEPYLAG